MYDMSKIGTFMTWEEVVAEFPDRWVIMYDCELNKDKSIKSGKLFSVFIDIDMAKEFERAIKAGIKPVKSRRTTQVVGYRW